MKKLTTIVVMTLLLAAPAIAVECKSKNLSGKWRVTGELENYDNSGTGFITLVTNKRGQMVPSKSNVILYENNSWYRFIPTSGRITTYKWGAGVACFSNFTLQYYDGYDYLTISGRVMWSSDLKTAGGYMIEGPLEDGGYRDQNTITVTR